MSELDKILDRYAKCGILDGFFADRIGEAVRRDAMRHEALVRAARAVVDAVENDMADADHRDGNGLSAVVEWRCCPARDCLTTSFNALVDELKGYVDEEG